MRTSTSLHVGAGQPTATCYNTILLARRLAPGILLALALAALSAAPSFGARGHARAVHAPGSCAKTDKGTAWEAVFGHFPSRKRALAYRRLVAAHGFRDGVVVEDEGCGVFELSVEGDFGSKKVQVSFVKETRPFPFHVTFEPPGPPQTPPGTFTAVFGHRHTLAQANALAWRAADRGFRLVDVERRAPGNWAVVVRAIPEGAASSFAHATVKAHLKIVFEPAPST